MRGHYRTPLNYSDLQLQDAKNSLDRLYRALRGKDAKLDAIDWNDPDAAIFKAAMDDDFNTPEAIALLFKLSDEVFAGGDKADLLLSLANVLGLLQRDMDNYFRGDSGGANDGLSAAAIEAMIKARNAARKAKDFSEADRIRKQLSDAKIVLEDAAGGTIWRRG